MSSLSAKPDKCAILQETVNQIHRIKQESECGLDLQQSEVSSSKPTLLAHDVLLGPYLLQALEGFLFVVNTDGKIEFVSDNVTSFMKYRKDELVGKSIYNIIHVGDHARFSSNLLPMSIGNGLGWMSDAGAKSRNFNCRFLIKGPEDTEETMEEKQTRVPQYENTHISALSLPYPPGDKQEEGTELQNCLVCIAQRIPSSEKTNSASSDQFRTHLDVTGKILMVEGVTAEQMGREMVGQLIQELCHPPDFHKVDQHLKETLQTGINTSGVWRLRVAPDKLVHIQSKSKCQLSHDSKQIIMATHSIIRDNETPSHMLENNSRGSPCTSRPPSNGPAANGAPLPPSGGNFGNFHSLSPSQQDFMGDLALDIFPGSSWDGLTSFAAPNVQMAPSSSVTTTGRMIFNSSFGSKPSFNQDMLGRGPSPCASPATQLSSTSSPGSAPAAFSNSFPYSPVSTPPINPSSGKSSPASVSAAPCTSSLQPGFESLSPSLPDSQTATQKLRNLLTQGIEEADSSGHKNTCESGEGPSSSAEDGGRNENTILRELLNQEDEEEYAGLKRMSSHDAQPENCRSDLSDRRATSNSGGANNNNNNMLRKLLNNDDESEKSYRKPQDLLQKLLKAESPEKMGQGDQPTSSSPADGGQYGAKRKTEDGGAEGNAGCDSAPKRPHVQAHLAGQNPMLASMLAQTPRTLPSVPTSIANSIISQLPQERLPKNLEKKLIHTPLGQHAARVNPTSDNAQIPHQGFLNKILTDSGSSRPGAGNSSPSPLSQQQMAVQQPLARQQTGYGQFQQQSADGRAVGHSVGTLSPATQLNLPELLGGEGKMPNLDGVANQGPPDPLLSEILDQVWSMQQEMSMEAVVVTVAPPPSPVRVQPPPPVRPPSPPASSEESAILKYLDEVLLSPSPSANPAQDLNEKMAISAIQRQLMSFEVTPTRPPVMNAALPNYSQANQMAQLSPGAIGYGGPPYQQGQVAAPPAYSNAALQNRPRLQPHSNQQQQQLINAVALQRAGLLSQGAAIAANVSAQVIRRTMADKRQKLMSLSQTQKRLMHQQQHQLLTMQTQQVSESGAVFSENMNDLLNNTVAPNVSLQRSTDASSPRYPLLGSPSQLSPGQRSYSPVQPPNSFGGSSPAFQQQQQQQHRLSPHPLPAYSQQNRGPSPVGPRSPHLQLSPQGGQPPQWNQRTPSLQQQQNPMLNAQLSQQQSDVALAREPRLQPVAYPPRFPQRQMSVRSVSNPGSSLSRKSPYSTAVQQQQQQQGDFHPQSPLGSYQAPPPPSPQAAQQQRLQRVSSMPASSSGRNFDNTLLSPSFNQSLSAYGAPPTSFSDSSHFSFDQQSLQQVQYSPSSSSPSLLNDNSAARRGASSEYVRQELRAKVGARSQQQGLLSGGQQQGLSDLEVFSLQLEMSDGAPPSPSLFQQQNLLSVAPNPPPGGEAHNPTRMEEAKPNDQKKSLLQQLLSEPS